MLDRLGRPLKNLRISVTDRCNLRCSYCMPEQDYVWLPRQHLLSFEEIVRLAGLFQQLGAENIRITGGEPLLRKDLPRLIGMLSELGFADLAMTTNGVHLKEHARALKHAGLKRLTVSLDTLKPDVFRALSRRDDLDRVMEGFATADFFERKLDTVLIRPTNDGEIVDLLEFSRAHNAEVRFIEYMDVGGATRWSLEQVVTRQDILDVVRRHYGGVEEQAGRGSAPAERFQLPDGLTFGIIASVSQPFCSSCDRSRLTADGHWLKCLYARRGLDLRELLRNGASDGEILSQLSGGWSQRADRGAEERVEMAARGIFADRGTLQDNPRLEMHTRGG